MKQYMADFETTTNPEDCRVWAYAICDIDDPDEVIIGTRLDDFLDWCSEQKGSPRIFFHNLRFDLSFVIDRLFKLGFKHTTEPEDRQTKTFNTMISDKGAVYQCEIIFYRKGKNVRKVTLRDSLKLIPLPVKAIPKAFGLEEAKGSIDYTLHNQLPEGSPISDEEQDYIKKDVQIVAKALKFMFDEGFTKMTIGACALENYKHTIGKRTFERWYPTPEYHNDVKKSYRGGFTYLNPEFASKIVSKGQTYDVNSLYPSVMRSHDNPLPFGTPIFFQGKYQYNPIYPLYTQMFSCQFEIKKNKIPTIQIKHSLSFVGNEYLTSSHGEEVVLCLNSVDMELFFQQYDVYNITYHSGWMFKASVGMFDQYIDYWTEQKIKAGKEGNKGKRTIAKLCLNSLYGKFGQDTQNINKVPYMGEDGSVHYYLSDPKPKKGLYIAVASFITSYARRVTITSAQKIEDDFHAGKSKNRFVYADTDSLHIYSPDDEIPEGLDIDPYRLGAWKLESRFSDYGQKKGYGAKYLRQKCYIENLTEDVDNPNTTDYSLKITVAGMPDTCYDQVTFDNFYIGATYFGKKMPKVVDGGTVLIDGTFTIKK